MKFREITSETQRQREARGVEIEEEEVGRTKINCKLFYNGEKLFFAGFYFELKDLLLLDGMHMLHKVSRLAKESIIIIMISLCFRSCYRSTIIICRSLSVFPFLLFVFNLIRALSKRAGSEIEKSVRKGR